MMNIYFSCSLTGGRQDESVYMTIVDHLLEIGHDVPTAHLAHPQVMDLERVVDAREVYERDMAWIAACDVLIAEVSTPSHGVGYEIAVALLVDIHLQFEVGFKPLPDSGHQVPGPRGGEVVGNAILDLQILNALRLIIVTPAKA